MDVKTLHSCLSMFLSGDSHEDSNGASSLSFFDLFSSLVDPIQALLIISFSSFQIPSHVGAPLNHPLLLLYCSGVLKISQKARLVIQDPFNIFHDFYLIQAI